MSVRITEPDQVALYDSTSGIAFGQVFDDRMDAEDFLAWHDKKAEQGELFNYGKHRVQFVPDVRIYSNVMLETVYQLWRSERREQ